MEKANINDALTEYVFDVKQRILERKVFEKDLSKQRLSKFKQIVNRQPQMPGNQLRPREY